MATVQTLMNTSLVTVGVHTSLLEALTLMRRYDFRQLPVVKHGQLVGIVTDRDLRLYLTERDGTIDQTEIESDRLKSVKVGNMMTRKPITLTPDAEVSEAIEIILLRKIGAIPVISNGEEKELVGIVTEHDLLELLQQLLSEVENPVAAVTH